MFPLCSPFFPLFLPEDFGLSMPVSVAHDKAIMDLKWGKKHIVIIFVYVYIYMLLSRCSSAIACLENSLAKYPWKIR